MHSINGNIPHSHSPNPIGTLNTPTTTRVILNLETLIPIPQVTPPPAQDNLSQHGFGIEHQTTPPTHSEEPTTNNTEHAIFPFLHPNQIKYGRNLLLEFRQPMLQASPIITLAHRNRTHRKGRRFSFRDPNTGIKTHFSRNKTSSGRTKHIKRKRVEANPQANPGHSELTNSANIFSRKSKPTPPQRGTPGAGPPANEECPRLGDSEGGYTANGADLRGNLYHKVIRATTLRREPCP